MNVSKSIPDCLDPWLDTSSNCWPLDETPLRRISRCLHVPIQTDDPPLWDGQLSSSARVAALSETQEHCLNCHKDTHSLKQCRHPFQNLVGIFNPDLGTLGDDGEAYRRSDERMLRHRRKQK